MSPVEYVFDVFRKSGADLYLGEEVTQLQHALQAAHLAVRDGASEPRIAAALLHDIGHLMQGAGEDTPGVDFRHEELGASWLGEHFPEEVCMPVRLHVAAKRYLCATDSSYMGRLSAASLHSLGLQGGPMAAEEVREFQASPFFPSAVKLRLWDEEAKDPSFDAPQLACYEALLARLVRAPRSSGSR
jgi:phosphonate degradation associated HDIG domain protein